VITIRTIFTFSVLSACLIGSRATFGQQSQGTAAAAASQGGELQEIVVTAQRRNEKLQDVPITVDVLTDESAAKAHVWDNMTLQTQVPGLLTSR